jgi:hypothetical protein
MICRAVGKMKIPFANPNARYVEAKRRQSPIEKEIQDTKCTELKGADIIEPSTAVDYALNCTMPGKKDVNGEMADRRFCVDARPMNNCTAPLCHHCRRRCSSA